MPPAQRDGELVADFAAERSWLRELEMMGIAWRLLADKAGLAAHEREVLLVALARCFLRKGKPDTWLRVGRANSLSQRNRSRRLHRVSPGKLVRCDADLAR